MSTRATLAGPSTPPASREAIDGKPQVARRPAAVPPAASIAATELWPFRLAQPGGAAATGVPLGLIRSGRCSPAPADVRSARDSASLDGLVLRARLDVLLRRAVPGLCATRRQVGGLGHVRRRLDPLHARRRPAELAGVA